MGCHCIALWVICEKKDMMYRKTGGVRAGEGVVAFPGTPICQQRDRCGRVSQREEVFSVERDIPFSQPASQRAHLNGVEWTLACY